MNLTEIEVRFLEIDKEALLARLRELGAEDRGEVMLEEIIFYDAQGKWQGDAKQFIKLRKKGETVFLVYKNQGNKIDDTEEIEFTVSDMKRAELFLERLGYPAFRHQQKRRHTFVLDEVFVDIDTWPRIPTYVELEGESAQLLKDTAEKLGLAWDLAVTDNPRKVIEERYHIPVGSMTWFTFDRFE